MAKKEIKSNVKCMDCSQAVLLQWDRNPVIAVCNKSKCREVANSLRDCQYFSKAKERPTIIKKTHFT